MLPQERPMNFIGRSASNRIKVAGLKQNRGQCALSEGVPASLAIQPVPSDSRRFKSSRLDLVRTQS